MKFPAVLIVAWILSALAEEVPSPLKPTTFKPQGEPRAVTALSWAPDGREFVVSSKDGSLCSWDPETAKVVRRFVEGNPKGECVNDIATYSPDGALILAYHPVQFSIVLWERVSGNLLRKFPGTDYTTVARWSPDGKTVLTHSGGKDGSIRFWDSASGNETRKFPGYQVPTDLAWCPDGKSFVSWIPVSTFATGGGGEKTKIWLAPGDNPNEITTWDKNGKKLSSLKVRLENASDTIQSVAFAPYDTRIVCGATDHQVRIIDIKKKKVLLTLKGHEAIVTRVAWSPDGERIASGSWDKTVRIWEAKTGKMLTKLDAETRPTCVAWSPDGHQILAGTENGTCLLWSLEVKQNP
jgi:WD40 repeat protein